MMVAGFVDQQKAMAPVTGGDCCEHCIDRRNGFAEYADTDWNEEDLVMCCYFVQLG